MCFCILLFIISFSASEKHWIDSFSKENSPKKRQSQQLVCTSLAEQFSVDLEKEVNPFAHLVFNLSD